jgi:hypothetical protein
MLHLIFIASVSATSTLFRISFLEIRMRRMRRMRKKKKKKKKDEEG